MGNVFKNLANCCWPEEDDESSGMLYHRVSYFIFRPAFLKLRYVNSELIREVINFDDISACDRERRSDNEKKHFDPPEALYPWFDNTHYEEDSITSNPWTECISCAVVHLKEFCTNSPSEMAIDKQVSNLTKVWKNLSDTTTCSDTKLLRALSNKYSMTADGIKLALKNIAAGVAKATASYHDGKASSFHMIGVLSWICLRQSKVYKPYFVAILKEMFEEDLIDEEAIMQWYEKDNGELIAEKTIPEVTDSAKAITAEEFVSLKASCKSFIEWLAESEDEDDDEEKDEDD